MIIDPVLKLPQEEKRGICNIEALHRDEGDMNTKYITVRTERPSYCDMTAESRNGGVGANVHC